MKTKEIKIDSKFFEFDTFKVEKHVEQVGERLYTQFNIYTGRDEDKHYIFTHQLSFFNFDNYKEAQEMCDKLNRIADKYHENR
jgi:hypothetical protein